MQRRGGDEHVTLAHRMRRTSESPLRTEADMNTIGSTESNTSSFFDTSEYVSRSASLRCVLRSDTEYFMPNTSLEQPSPTIVATPAGSSTPIPSTPATVPSPRPSSPLPPLLPLTLKLERSQEPRPVQHKESIRLSTVVLSQSAVTSPERVKYKSSPVPAVTAQHTTRTTPPPAKKVCTIALKPIVLGKKQLTFCVRAGGAAKEPEQGGLSEEDREVCLWVRKWGLPSTIADYYIGKGIKSFYNWQIKCLTNQSFTEGKSLVYTLPTSSGKTLVAEIALLKCVILQRKVAIFVLPFVSIVVEKMRSFERIGKALDFIVDGFYGSRGQLPLTPGARLVVGTIERVNGLVNSLIEENRLDEVGCVVVDEVHMVGDGERGATLELLLSKLVYHSCYTHKSKEGLIQLLAMSATVPNVCAIGRWLRAETFCHEFRPVPLHEYTVETDPRSNNGGNNPRRGQPDKNTKVRVVRDKEGNIVRRFTLTDKDYDGTVFLCSEVVPDHSALVFCSTKALTQTTAALIADLIDFYRKQKTAKKEGEGGGSCTDEATTKATTVAEEEEEKAEVNRMEQRKRLLELLTACTGGHLNETLAKTVPKGVAFHNAGLTTEEREIIEQGYRDHVINILCSTSTLAVGVNLPARRVIIRSPFVGRDPMSPKYYKQMAGRAGRAGYDTFGESFLILQNTKDTLTRGRKLLQSDVDAIHSCLLSVGGSGGTGKEEKKGIERLVLEGICQSPNGTVSFDDVTNLVGCTFLAAENENAKDILESNGGKVVESLMERKFVVKSEEDGTTHYKATKFGKATFHSCFLPEEAKIMHQVLEKANSDGVILLDDVHTCYLLTPLTNLIPPNWELFAQILRLHDCSGNTGRNQLRYTLGRIGARISTVERRATGGCPRVTPEEDLALRRLYNALILSDLVHEKPLADVAAKYGAQAGMLQGLMQSAGSFARMSVCFCHNMEWTALEAVLNTFVERLNLGVKAEIIPLTEISGVGRSRARALWNAGFKSVEAIAHTSIEDLRRHVRLGPFDERAATIIVQGARNLLSRKAKEAAQKAASIPSTKEDKSEDDLGGFINLAI